MSQLSHVLASEAIVLKVKMLLASLLPYMAAGRGFLQIQHGSFLVVMLFFSTCTNMPEVRSVENNNEEEQTAFLDLGLPQEV